MRTFTTATERKTHSTRAPTCFTSARTNTPYYPGTGAFNEVGTGGGEGFTVNLPLEGGYGDGDYALLIDEIIAPVAREFVPDLIMLSAGYDIHESDPLGAMRVTPSGFAGIFERMLALADELCAGRFVAVLEGGYDIPGLTGSVKESLLTMLAEPAGRERKAPPPLRREEIRRIVETARRVQSPYWKSLSSPRASVG
ncbi:MAG: hypothetical protein M5R36_18570 [Deltaproteobacteria bacterium]|nr:hypothetical protein [Deltaproteobacteria bacterium]